MSFVTNHKGLPMDDKDSSTWYHGSPLVLTTLAAGSAITRRRDIAVAFSHKPTLTVWRNDGTIRHNGARDGYLYRVDEPLGENDAWVHPGIERTDAWEWTTGRDLKLALIERTTVPRSAHIGKLEAVLLGLGTWIATRLRHGSLRFRPGACD